MSAITMAAMTLPWNLNMSGLPFQPPATYQFYEWTRRWPLVVRRRGVDTPARPRLFLIDKRLEKR
jgi:hypothetical protein